MLNRKMTSNHAGMCNTLEYLNLLSLVLTLIDISHSSWNNFTLESGMLKREHLFLDRTLAKNKKYEFQSFVYGDYKIQSTESKKTVSWLRKHWVQRVQKIMSTVRMGLRFFAQRTRFPAYSFPHFPAHKLCIFYEV